MYWYYFVNSKANILGSVESPFEWNPFYFITKRKLQYDSAAQSLVGRVTFCFNKFDDRNVIFS